MAKAREQDLVSFDFINPRDFTKDRHRTVDDRPYGGGPGMVMMLEPLLDALRSMERPGRILVMSPDGRQFSQADAQAWSQEEDLTLVCGRYEGIDARLEELAGVELVSVGDFVLGGGESGALCVVEAVSRLLPGFMGHESSGTEESFSDGLLEYPHYTRPPVFEGAEVPPILLSGDHGRIAEWRRQRSLEVTLDRRPDLLTSAELDAKDFAVIKKSFSQTKRLGRNIYLLLLHYPVVDQLGKIRALSLTNLDIHDIARCSCTYGVGGYFIATPLDDQRKLAQQLVGHWTTGAGADANPDRAKALSKVTICRSLEESIAAVTERTGERPRLVATSARVSGSMTVPQVRSWLDESPLLIILGTGSGLAKEVIEQCDAVLRPVRPYGPYNHLSVRSAAAILLDRILGDVF